MKRQHHFSDYWIAWLNPFDGPSRNFDLSRSEVSYLTFIGLGEWPYKAIRFTQIMLSFGWVIYLPDFRSIPIIISFCLMIATYVALSAVFACASLVRFRRKKKGNSSLA